ncbi:YicC/YloC family endoribonuclease [Dokdonella sp. MW10]|uniref:YicC/YloC family endoribonuclease n=1 Tax=Dokdonella sp. MW10 TaxID=2992926 RepID=UPI003F8155A9
MIRSMTAFASAERETAHGNLGIELRSVNHRYLELSPRLPDDLRSFEPQLRDTLNARLSRGKVDVTVRFKPASTRAAALVVDQEVVDRLADTAAALTSRFPSMRVSFTDVLGWPGVLRDTSPDADSLREQAQSLLDEALGEFIATREREGERLAGFVRERLDGIEAIVAGVREHLPEVRAAARARLDLRLAEIKQPVDPGRIEQEIVMQLQRLDVDEELDRLSSHIVEARRILGLREAVGRRLDFLMQEFNREANTLGSKAADPRTTKAAVELKVLIEQMREQIQNLE